ncbi:hypothetical protein WH47_08507 [Habropoda laboriosa]|uniref:Uncharacterized protein n=1 Tax=Habropoda laboriosa TaxID=597456 RepID=A0A0L7QPA5_9HYME|nr:hypothetical protein WH47_08507 [Habropoda laboriosa]
MTRPASRCEKGASTIVGNHLMGRDRSKESPTARKRERESEKELKESGGG